MTVEWDVVRTPADKSKRMPRESLRRGNDALPKPPALWNAVPIPDLEPAPCYGRYPKNFLEWALRVMDVPSSEVLHVCSGGMSHQDALGGYRLDLRQDARPDFLADGRALPFADESWRAVMLDPPYSIEYAEELYGVEYPRPSHLLSEAARVLKPGGAIGFMHFLVPFAPAGCKVASVHGVMQGLGYRIKAFTVFRKDQRQLFT